MSSGTSLWLAFHFFRAKSSIIVWYLGLRLHQARLGATRRYEASYASHFDFFPVYTARGESSQISTQWPHWFHREWIHFLSLKYLHCQGFVSYEVISQKGFRLPPKKKIYYQITRARWTVECAFGMYDNKKNVYIKHQWKPVLKCLKHFIISFTMKTVSVSASDHPHNATRSHHLNSSLIATWNTRPTAEDMDVRDLFKEYFVSPGRALE